MNTWDTFLHLRPLIVFAMACPALIVAALLSLLDKRSEAEKSEETGADSMPQGTLSALGTWSTDADSRAPSVASDEADSSTQKRAA